MYFDFLLNNKKQMNRIPMNFHERITVGLGNQEEDGWQSENRGGHPSDQKRCIRANLFTLRQSFALLLVGLSVRKRPDG